MGSDCSKCCGERRPERRASSALMMAATVDIFRRNAVGVGKFLKKKLELIPKSAEETNFISNAVLNNKLFQTISSMDHWHVTRLAEIARKETVNAETEIITEGDVLADSFYIVIDGKFEVFATENNSTNFVGQGEVVGELALFYGEPRSATVTAVEKSTVWVIDCGDFRSILAEKSEEKILELSTHLEAVSNLACLSNEERKALAAAMMDICFKQGDLVVEQGDLGSVFYILYEGIVEVLKDGQLVNSLSASSKEKTAEYFGEAALLTNEERTATVRVKSAEARFLAVDRTSYDRCLGPLRQTLELHRREGMSRRPFSSLEILEEASFDKVAIQRVPSKFSTVMLQDLTKIGLLGCGGFGFVELVACTKSGKEFALKKVSKGFLVKSSMQHSVIRERQIQISLDSPFIVKLYRTFNDPMYAMFLLEVARGGDLHTTYKMQDLYGSVKHSQYYVAGAALALQYLHDRQVVYRDLKPENLILTETGFIKLTDMGLAKIVQDKTYTACGTLDYFAPEVIQCSGHGEAVDWWELGVLVFELMSGTTPFKASEPRETFKAICAGIEQVKFPQTLKGVIENLVKQLCKRQPSERLPMRAGGIENIEKHPWYVLRKFDWQEMRLGKLDGPFKPKVKSKEELARDESVAVLPPVLDYVDDGSGWDAELDDE